jgi:hypothetical protein
MDKRDTAKRDAKREFEERTGTARKGIAQKGAFELASTFRDLLRNDKEPRRGAFGEFVSAPARAGGQFGIFIGGRIKMNCTSRFVGSWFVPRTPRVKEGTLDGKKAIESDHQKRCP